MRPVGPAADAPSIFRTMRRRPAAIRSIWAARAQCSCSGTDGSPLTSRYSTSSDTPSTSSSGRDRRHRVTMKGRSLACCPITFELDRMGPAVVEVPEIMYRLSCDVTEPRLCKMSMDFCRHLLAAHGICEFHDLFEEIGLCLCLTITLNRISAGQMGGFQAEGHRPTPAAFAFVNRVGFVSFRKASPCTVTSKLAVRGRDSACPVYAWGFWAPSHVSANFNQRGRGSDSV